MTNPISFNILAHTVASRARLAERVARLNPAALLVMDDFGTAEQMRGASPDTLVIYRASHPTDSSWHTSGLPPGEWLDAYGHYGRNGFVVQAFNEPGVDAASAPQFVRWCVELMAVAAARGVRLALPNFAVGNPNEQLIASGALDDLWRAFAQYPQHVLAVHEYFKANPLSGGERPWLIERYKFIHDRFRALRLTVPRTVVTEFGRDLAGKRGPDGDGWRANGFTEASYFDAIKRAVDAVYAPANIPVCIFSYGPGYGGDWQSFDVEQADALIESIIAYRAPAAPPPPPPPDDDTQELPAVIDIKRAALRTGSTALNVRAAPNTTSASLATLRSGLGYVLLSTVSDGQNINGDRRWHRVLASSANGVVEGYASAYFLQAS